MLTMMPCERIPLLVGDEGLPERAREAFYKTPGVAFAVRCRDAVSRQIIALCIEPTRRPTRKLVYLLDGDLAVGPLVDELVESDGAFVNPGLGEGYRREQITVIGECFAVIEDPA